MDGQVCKCSTQEYTALFSQTDTANIAKWMFAVGAEGSDSTEAQTENTQVTTCCASRLNKDEILGMIICLVARCGQRY